MLKQILLILVLFASLANAADANKLVLLNLHLNGNVADASPYRNTVSVLDGAGEPIEMKVEKNCKKGPCMKFSGQNQDADSLQVRLPAAPNSPITISLWIKPADFGSNYHQLNVFHSSDYQSPGEVTFDNGIFYMRTSGDEIIDLFRPESIDSFNQLTVVYDSSGATVYWNGEKKRFVEGATIDLSQAPLEFGSAQSFGNPFEGYMDEIKVINAALYKEHAKRWYQMDREDEKPGRENVQDFIKTFDRERQSASGRLLDLTPEKPESAGLSLIITIALLMFFSLLSVKLNGD